MNVDVEHGRVRARVRLPVYVCVLLISLKRGIIKFVCETREPKLFRMI